MKRFVLVSTEPGADVLKIARGIGDVVWFAGITEFWVRTDKTPGEIRQIPGVKRCIYSELSKRMSLNV